MLKPLEKLAESLSAESVELIPFLPYLLQDLWMLGSSPIDMIDLISKHINVNKNTKILDLGCGKGAVGIQISKALGCYVKGIDILEEFIEEAKFKAIEFKVENFCEFEVNDINQSVKTEKNYDIVILGALGSVLGNPLETLTKLKQTIRQRGYIIIDDGYAKEKYDETILTRHEWHHVISSCGLELIEEMLVNDEDLENVLDDQMTKISKRVNELIEIYPEIKNLFNRYMENQLYECQTLTNEIQGVTLLMRQK